MSQTRIRRKLPKALPALPVEAKTHNLASPKSETVNDEQFNELFAKFEAETSKNSLLTPVSPPPKSKILTEKTLGEGLGWLGLIVVALLLFAITGEVTPFSLIIGFSFLVLAPAAYFLVKKDRAKPAASTSRNQIAREIVKAGEAKQKASESSNDNPGFVALKVGTLSALYFCAALVAAAILAVVTLALSTALR